MNRYTDIALGTAGHRDLLLGDRFIAGSRDLLLGDRFIAVSRDLLLGGNQPPSKEFGQS